MPIPIQESLSRLQSGLPLFQQDLLNIARAFAFLPEQDRLLTEIHALNPKLAETLLIFRERLQQAAADASFDIAADQVFLHYVINTDGPIPEAEGEDPFDVFEAATRYAKTLCVDVRKDQNENAVLSVNGKEQLCPSWGAVPGWSAAWSLRQVGPVINRARYGRNDVIPSFLFGFDEHREEHRLKNAMTLADFAHLAYFEAAYVEKHLLQWGYDQFRWVENADTDTQAFVAGKGDHLVICFRGTSSGSDAAVDVNFLKTDAYGGRGRVHQGFQQSLDSVWEAVKDAVDALGAEKKLFFCGHSLGAALAQLAAHRFALAGYPVAGVYVYGSPRVGNSEFKEAYDELLEAKTFLHINDEDIVPQIPPPFFGFHHLGGPPRVFNEGHLIHMADTDPRSDAAELRFEDMSQNEQEQVAQQVEEVQGAIRAATKFLRKPAQQFSGASYGTSFESGALDDHSMGEYLFKFACAIVDGAWKKVKKG